MNVLFVEADLASHECFPMHGRISTTFTRKVGLLWTCVCSFCLLKLSSAYVVRKDSRNLTLLATRKLHKARKKGTKQPGTEATARVPKKACTEKHCNHCKKHGGTYMRHNTHDYRWFKKDGMEKSNFRAAKKSGKKPNPTKQFFAQLSKKLDKLEKVIKKKHQKSGSAAVAIVIPTPNRELGWVA